MCTAVSWESKNHYFGRTLDLEYSLGEQVIITPRNAPLSFRRLPPQERHYAIIGMGVESNGTVLYFDAVNEMGLGMAALNFPGYARFHSPKPNTSNVASFELIPWILSQCASLKEARAVLEQCNVTDDDFSPQQPATPLHWLLADSQGSLVVESVRSGLKLYAGIGVLTNAPEYPRQLELLNAFGGLTDASSAELRGSGSLCLPGDLTSQGRFIRGQFAKEYSAKPSKEADAVEQFFHVLDMVSQPKGCVKLPDGQLVCTQYASCCNTDKGIYYYVTRTNRRINAVDLHRTDLNGARPICVPLNTAPDINPQN